MFGYEKNQLNFCADVQTRERLKSTTGFRVTAAEILFTITDLLEAPLDQLRLDQQLDRQLDQSLDRSKELLDRQLDQPRELRDQSQAQLDHSKEQLDQQLDR